MVTTKQSEATVVSHRGAEGTGCVATTIFAMAAEPETDSCFEALGDAYLTLTPCNSSARGVRHLLCAIRLGN